MQLKSQDRSADATISRHVAGLCLRETLYPPRLHMGRHGHSLAAIGVVLKGGYTERVGRQTRQCDAGTVLFHPAGEEHAVEFCHEPARVFRVDFSSEWLARLREHPRVLDSPSETRGGRTAGLALQLYREFRATDSAAALAIQGLVLEMLADAARRPATASGQRPPRWLHRAREFMRAHFAEPLTLETIANEVGVHPAHLAREFRRTYGNSIGQSVRLLRVEHACRALSKSNLSLAAIAADAGFADQSHFTRVFRSLTGLTPLEYRRSLRPR